MELFLIRGILLASLLAIFYQDQKERRVYTWLFGVLLISFMILHWQAVGTQIFGFTILINSGILLCLFLVLYGYVRLRLSGTPFLETFALGDVFFLIALAFGFSTLSFVTLLVFGLVFSLILHLLWHRIFNTKNEVDSQNKFIKNPRLSQQMQATVPLAGYLSLFFTGVMLVHWLGFYDQLYLV